MLPVLYVDDRSVDDQVLIEFGAAVNDYIRWRSASGLSVEERARLLDESMVKWRTISGLIKHRSFAGENEWRLIGVSQDRGEVRHRPGGEFIRSYLEFELEWTMIESITVGPRAHPDLAREAVVSMLADNGVESVAVKDTASPYRP